MSRYTAAELDLLANQFDTDGMVVLRRHFARDTLLQWRNAFDVLLEHRLRTSATAVRGPNRHYITLPFAGVFADEAIFADPDLLGIVERVAGDEPVMCQLASDTPLDGSDYQDVHRDTPALFEGFPETPSFQLAVNFPLCDVTLDNGPFETTLGTHRMHSSDALEAYEAGRAPLHAITMELGDVMIRDVRALHRGTPNRTQTPRPMVVIGYSRSWYFRPEVKIDVPESVYQGLGARAKRLLRHMPRVSDIDDNATGENYTKFAY
ncbi:phytanoyl-CoA dioxygenase family protein [Paraburkholderia sp. Tr-20389]|uniref:phytanoyl-CoA dioxygenase family protein n=1 Tax=Paraburkholderia sp. Tr-20389 TaxID=2703903 RepID=UPI0019800773|nr:phytanoyl-CoA dioxygenase family protein [Paraburkholderia sp. Tr-20389]MBN3756311.1 phytanoyl-CoA dioxygenase family protein [Paraburkholderia sp. Tr-20389]